MRADHPLTLALHPLVGTRLVRLTVAMAGSEWNGSSESDDELDHVTRHLFDSELERIAFARPQNEAEQRRAAAAAAELARRAADRPALSGEVEEHAPERASAGASAKASARASKGASARSPSIPRADVASGVSLRAPRTGETRPGWWRTVVIVGTGIMVVIAATSIAPAIPGGPAKPSSLDVFARDANPDEVELGSRLQREGLRVSATPRVIAQRDGVEIIAYRFVLASPAESPRNQVCLLLGGDDTLGSPQCADRADVERVGILASLASESGTFVVRWGPGGAAEVSILGQNQVQITRPRSAAALTLLTAEQSTDDLAYAGVLRTLHPDDRLLVRLLSRSVAWDAVGALVAAADTGRWSYCVHLFPRDRDPRDALGASVTCAGREQFERDGLTAQSRSGATSISIEWSPDDSVQVDDGTEP